MAFKRSVNVIVPPQHTEGTARVTAEINFAKRVAELLVQRAKGSQDTAAPRQSGKEPKRAREDFNPAAES